MFTQLLTISIATLWVAAFLGRRLGFVDHPNSRKLHLGRIPLVGGVSIFGSLVAGVIAYEVPPYSDSLLMIATLLFAVGLYDDWRHLRAASRLTIQFIAGALLAGWGGIAITEVGNLLTLGPIHLLWLTIPLSALAVAGLSNAYNMIDGIDGLAASMITLPLAVLYVLAVTFAHPDADFLLLLLVPLGVFLVFNLGPDSRTLPKVFLGDNGSITLGFLVTASLIYFSQGSDRLIRPVTALWLVSVPLMDMIATMARRVQLGHKLMQADRSHLHHNLMDLGLSARQTLAAMSLYALACASAGLALEAAPEAISLLLYCLLFVSHCLFVFKASASDRPWYSPPPAPVD